MNIQSIAANTTSIQEGASTHLTAPIPSSSSTLASFQGYSPSFCGKIGDFFTWMGRLIKRIFCCGMEGARENRRLKEIDRLLTSFQEEKKQQKDGDFKVWWKDTFNGFSKELQDRLLKIDQETRGVDERGAVDFIYSLIRVNSGGKVLDPRNDIPKYLLSLKEALTTSS